MSIQHPSSQTSQAGANSPGTRPKTATLMKSDLILRALRCKAGASIEDLCTLTGWQPHSVRGFLSGTVKRKLGHQIHKHKDAKGKTRYIIDRKGAKA